MGRPVLLLRLEGPLQSWGVRSRWDVRDTQPEPTKSGVVGLLGCALGYGMGDVRLEIELDQGLRFGVRTEAPGTVLQDFQTVTDYLPTAEGTYRHSGVRTGASLSRIRSDAGATPSTILSPRAYLQDAAFLVALEERPTQPGLLRKCADALADPRWPLFLGRKACVPTRPVLEALTEVYAGIEDALTHHSWSHRAAGALERKRPTAQSLEAWVEVDGSSDGATVRQDAVRTNTVRQFGFRYARRLEVPFADLAGTGPLEAM
jgi:CRISPR system Cascade subunit CasD